MSSRHDRLTEPEYWLLMNLVFHGGLYEAEDLEYWFGIGGEKESSSDPYRVSVQIQKRYGTMMLPDLCGNCCTTFGATLGGVLRQRCLCCSTPVPFVNDEGSWNPPKFFKQLSAFDHITQNYGTQHSAIVYFISYVFPTRVYDGPINKDISYDPRYHGAG